MQVPILNGIYADGTSDFRTSYPRNLIPVPKQQGISQGYLRPAEGIEQFAMGLGIDRGGINWNGQMHRVMGDKLVRVNSNGTVDTLCDIGGSGQVTLDYSFDRLAIASGGSLYYWNGTTLTMVTDADLGTVIDFVWVDGYFMSTDGQYLIVTDLNDPTSVNPLKYGSSEADPDPVVGLLKLRNEVYALNRYTVEVFQNVGGNFFPFQRIEGAQMMRGAIGTFAACEMILDDAVGVAFLGSGRNEPPSVWFGVSGATLPLASREIDTILQEYSETELSQAVLETRVNKKHITLYVHLSDQTLCYDAAASKIVGQPVWYVLTTSMTGRGLYRARNFVWCYDRWLCGDPAGSNVGALTEAVSSHWGEANGWDFGTIILYNEGRGAIFNELELVCLTGNVSPDADPTIWASYTMDGRNWSQERPRSAGRRGETAKRITWLQQGHMRNWRCQRFRGTSDAHLTMARLQIAAEPLNV